MKKFIVFLYICFTLPLSVAAVTLNFSEVLDQAISHNMDLKIASADIGVAEAARWQVLSEYFFTLGLQANLEQVKDLTRNKTVFSIGGNTYGDGSKYQASLSAQLSRTLFDFGILDSRSRLADLDVKAKQLGLNQVRRDLKLKVLELYAQLTVLQREYRDREKILALFRDIYKLQKKMHAASFISKVELATGALDMAKAEDTRHDLAENFRQQLTELSYYTGVTYNAVDTEFSTLPDVQLATSNITQNLGQRPEIKVLENDLALKAEQLVLEQKQRLPVFDFYSRYLVYDSDPNRAIRAVDGFNETNLVFGISAAFTFFDGFKRSARITQLKYEVEKSRLELARKKEQLRSEQTQLLERIQSGPVSLANKAGLVAQQQEREALVDKLTRQEAAQYIDYLQQAIQSLEQTINLESVEVNTRRDLIKQSLLTE